ncbi:MAG: DUF4124 domain-containing protein [Chromatiales bacterium]|nr:MAG: DUF4124 domain-containing protein [Chromatiales bacterium]
MNNQKWVLGIVCLLAISFSAGAQEIYKRTNADGVVEFSDRPFANGTQVEVRPNVVATNPVARRPRAPAAEAESDAVPAAPAADRARQVTSDNDVNYVRARRTRAARDTAENRRERREQRGYREERPSTNPDPGRATRNAARAAAQRPGGR